MSEKHFGTCSCCGSFSDKLEEFNINHSWPAKFCPACAKELRESLESFFVTPQDTAHKLLALFVKENAVCITEPIDTIEDNDGTVMLYYAWVEPSRAEEAVKIISAKSEEWGSADDVGDVTLIECIEEGLHDAGIRYLIEETPETEDGIPSEDSGKRYMLMEVCDREISVPVFFKTLELAKFAMLARVASTKDISVADVLAECGLDMDDCSLPDDMGVSSDRTVAWAENKNHDVIDWRIVTIDTANI